MNPSGPSRPAAGFFSARRKLILVWVVTALVLLGLVTVAVVRTGPAAGTDFLAGPQNQRQEHAAAPAPQTPSPEALAAQAAVALDADIQRILTENSGYRIGVVLADTRGGERRSYGDGSEFVAASTAKIITAAAYYHLVETGEKSLDVPLGSYDAAFQLKAMVNASSNDAWLLLMQDIGYPRLIDYAASIRISYDPEQNLLTPAEMAELLKQLSTGKLLNAEHTQELLGYMQQTNNERLIPAAVGPDITVQHKYGELGGYVHDAAVLTSGERSYALAIYTWGEDGESEERLNMIHELAGVVTKAMLE
ncbi:beta-lactamase class A [Arthrobacter ginsengisoli]|uniref:Beta-lactamase class A n=1 Tax=Arthrobacter ginsengisoli TaxID=1356565 RepID=A0ABU1UIL7_9MICC|nr:serine hydrolase [Arthrobacter ginsengisoli]MDR7084980.1 beta-lactamase class A [Arthrobacter ginsengisoli]